MTNVIRLKLIVSLCLLLISMLFTTGCSCLLPSPTPYGPRVTGDGTGGAIAVYEVRKGSNQRAFYAQKIGSEGDTLWGEKGVLVGSGYKTSDSFFDLHIVNDGSNGAIIAWGAYPSRSRQIPYITHITRVDSEGSILWQKEVRDVDHMITDGAGGAIITTVYSYNEKTLFVIKVDSEGSFPWGEDGIWMYREEYQCHSFQVASDGSDGAIVIWQESHAEPGLEPHRPEITERIFAQRINSEGSLLWGHNGVLLYIAPEGVNAEEAQVISDGSGGAIAVWHQWPLGKIEFGTPEALLDDICAQRVDADGNILWQQNGVPLGITKGGGVCPHTPLVVSDGSGGAIIIWEDLRQGMMSIYAQRIDAEGNIRWQEGGEEVCYIKSHSSFAYRTAVSDGSGGAIIVWGYKEAETNEEGLLAQRIDAAGRTVWPNNGVLASTARNRIAHAISDDGCGGVIVSWGAQQPLLKSKQSYVQRIDAEGNRLWADKGILLNP